MAIFGCVSSPKLKNIVDSLSDQILFYSPARILIGKNNKKSPKAYGKL